MRLRCNAKTRSPNPYSKIVLGSGIFLTTYSIASAADCAVETQLVQPFFPDEVQRNAVMIVPAG